MTSARLKTGFFFCIQVILDLGHLTFGNVSDWSAEEKELGAEPQSIDMEEDEDDDGIQSC